MIKSKNHRLGILVHISSFQTWPDLNNCIQNVLKGEILLRNRRDNFDNFENTFSLSNVDIHVNLVNSLILDYQKEHIISSLRYLNKSDLYVTEYSNIGLDIVPFFRQLLYIISNKIIYDYILKIHSQPIYNLRNHALECLCGTPIHISSVINIFKNNSNVGLISPHGFTFTPYSSKNKIHKILRDLISSKLRIAYPYISNSFFDDEINDKYNFKFDVPLKNLSIVAGNMYWVNFGIFKNINLNILENLSSYSDLDAIIELLLPSVINKSKMIIYEIIPAPKLFAIYFPQYHPIPENDKFWGKGFTEWTLLKPFKARNISKPLEVDQGGLGYYNLLDYEIRKRQKQLALNAGIYGFMIYHYWFKNSRKVLYKVPELILKDGQPDINFFLCWANEPWTKKWDGFSNKNSQVLLEQEYGNKIEWEIHFNYLLKFFKHKNYCKYNNMPIFGIYRIGHFKVHIISNMLKLWNNMAIRQGFEGLYIIATIGGFYFSDTKTEKILRNVPEIKAGYHFSPLVRKIFSKKKMNSIPINTQYFGHYTNFDNRPRSNSSYTPYKREILYKIYPTQFGDELRDILNNVDVKRWDNILFNFHFITAWNEWNEQAMLEPTQENRFELLDQIKTSLMNIHPKKYDPGDKLFVNINSEKGNFIKNTLLMISALVIIYILLFKIRRKYTTNSINKNS